MSKPDLGGPITRPSLGGRSSKPDIGSAPPVAVTQKPFDFGKPKGAAGATSLGASAPPALTPAPAWTPAAQPTPAQADAPAQPKPASKPAEAKEPSKSAPPTPASKSGEKAKSTEKPSPSKSGAGLWGSVRGWIAEKVNPDAKVAKMGTQMDAYFDKEKNRWVSCHASLR